MNHLEQQLRAWEPRRPSPELKRRLFAESQPWAAPREAKPAKARVTWVAWFTPATAAIALVAALAGTSAIPIGSAIASSTNAAYLSALEDSSRQSALNHVGTQSFTWTNAPLPPSTSASRSGPY